MSVIHDKIVMNKTTVIGEADIYHETDGIYLGNFEIYREYRGNGFASRALELLISKYKIDTLVVEQDNHVAVHLYKKFGFEVKQSYYAKDLGANVYYMKRTGL